MGQPHSGKRKIYGFFGNRIPHVDLQHQKYALLEGIEVNVRKAWSRLWLLRWPAFLHSHSQDVSPLLYKVVKAVLKCFRQISCKVSLEDPT